ncbi:mRNA-capping enzyme subunit alpha, partial [Dictyocoela roeselum]
MQLPTILTEISAKDHEKILCLLANKLKIRSEFFGVHPVTLMKTHIYGLLTEDYYVCEKSDGIRVLFIVLPGGSVVVFDRTNKIYSLGLKIPFFKMCMFDTEITFQEHVNHDNVHVNTDGITVDDINKKAENDSNPQKNDVDSAKQKHNDPITSTIENTPDKKENKPPKNKDTEMQTTEYTENYRPPTIHIRIFDTLMFNDEPQVNNPLNVRLNCALYFVQTFYLRFKTADYFKISVKQMCKSYGISCALEQARKYNLVNDGLIFTPVNYPYVFSRCHRLWKWKPPELNTVDFIIKINCFIELVLIHEEREIVMDRYLADDFFMNGEYGFLEKQEVYLPNIPDKSNYGDDDINNCNHDKNIILDNKNTSTT